MAQFAHNCPHCDTKIGLEVIAAKLLQKSIYSLYLKCGNCAEPSIIKVIPLNPPALEGNVGHPGAVLNQLVSQVLEQIPRSRAGKAPDHIPADVERVFIQARSAHVRKEMDLAAMGYRRSVELALKAADPSIRGQLGPRTDALAARRVLSGSMKDWADNVRLLGNDANHDPPEPTDDAVEDLFLFTETLLEFLFTMPERVRLRRAATAEGKAGVERLKAEGASQPALPAPE